MDAPRPVEATSKHDIEQTAPRRRVSWPRLGLLVVVLGALTGAAVVSVSSVADRAHTPTASWGVPYVDVTLTPTFQFQDPAANSARTVALSFVVADHTKTCTPSWGGYYTLEAAASDLDLDLRIAQLRSSGGDVMVSLGGQANTELAVACTDQDKLTSAYRDIVTRYDLASIDLDIEGAAVADLAAGKRRAQALAVVQRERAKAGHPLQVWLTLPVAPTGLTPQAVSLVRTTLAGGVDVAGVNVMTMDYGGSKPAGVSMLDAAEQALQATAKQVGEAYQSRGNALSEAQRWAKLGATPMIGQNDVDGEVFTLADAQGLVSFARERGLGRMSMWSANRDQPCGASFTGVAVHSNTCSGVDAPAKAFTGVLGDLTGTGPSAPVTNVVRDAAPVPVVDNPATSPYPVWRLDAQYPGGYKVVWRGKIYEARYYSTGADPSVVTNAGAPSSWALLGPVPATATAPKPVPSVRGVTAAWNPEALYKGGARVIFDGLPYEARWASKGAAPSTLFPVRSDDAWQPLFAVPGEPAGS